MSNITASEIRHEFLKSRMGIVGIGILGILITTSIISIIFIPVETFQKWNNPENWISYPKIAVPVWINYFNSEKTPEHLILDLPVMQSTSRDGISLTTHQFGFEYSYDKFPNDFVYEFVSKYSGSPLLDISIIRPDGLEMRILSTLLPYSDIESSHNERIFSTDRMIKKNILMNSENFSFDISKLSPEDIIFSKTDSNSPLKGDYIFLINLYNTSDESQISQSKLIIGGKAFGIMGTDELRRDLAIGLLWGTPLALFIGLVVAIASVAMGLIYGVYAGYRGKKTDEFMMRFNDVIYALPALPFLIILSVTISNSIFVMAGFLMVFGWVGIAKVARSMTLQVKTTGYVDAATMMGQKDSKIIFRHILPQLLPYAFASIAISVPAAITTEAGLSFLGLGDPNSLTYTIKLSDSALKIIRNYSF